MADNVNITEGTGIAVAADEIASVKYQRVKMTLGADSVNDGDVSSSNPLPVSGAVAHDAADSGSPVKIGFKAETSPKAITLVADGDRTDGYADADGIQMVKPYTSYADIISERVTNTDGSSTALSTFGAAANLRNFVTTIAVYNSSATNGFVDFRDGTSGSVIFTAPLPTVGGSVITFPVPLRQPTANTALAFDVSGALSTVYISVVGFQSKA